MHSCCCWAHWLRAIEGRRWLVHPGVQGINPRTTPDYLSWNSCHTAWLLGIIPVATHKDAAAGIPLLPQLHNCRNCVAAHRYVIHTRCQNLPEVTLKRPAPHVLRTTEVSLQQHSMTARIKRAGQDQIVLCLASLLLSAVEDTEHEAAPCELHFPCRAVCASRPQCATSWNRHQAGQALYWLPCS
jgi:hypothetical protein